MRRIAPMMLVLALAAAACGGDGGNGPTPDPDGQAVEPLPPEAGEEEAADVDVPIPDVPLVLPSPGGPTTVRTRVEANGVDPVEDDTAPPAPGVFLARSPQEAELISRRIPPGAAERLRAWNQYGRLALIVVSAGPQPDARNRVRVDSVSVLEGGEVIQAFGEVVRQGQGAQVISVPWAVISMDVGGTVAAERCVIAFKGASARENRCR